MATSSLSQASVSTSGQLRLEAGSDPLPARSTRAISFRRGLAGGKELKLSNAAPCDHQAIGRLLISVHQRPSSEDFALQLEHPHHEPCDRLLVKHDGQLVGHVQLQWRAMRYLGQPISLCRLAWLAVLPEYRHHQVSEWLLETALDLARLERALLVECDGTIPPPAVQRLVAEGPFAARWQDSPRDVLSRLSADETHTPGITVRNWRQMELDNLCEIYDVATAGLTGPLVRSQAHWRWLIERAAYDHIFVALRTAPHEDQQRVVGYCVSRREHLLELLALPGEEQAAVELLRRTARDAIERGFHRLVLHGPQQHPLSRSFRSDTQAATNGRMLVLDAAGWLRHQRDELVRRASHSYLPLPHHVDFQIDGRPQRLEMTRRKVSLTASKPVQRCLTSDSSSFAGMLLGTLNAGALLESAALETKSQRCADVAVQLFPQIPWWRPLWDELPRN